MKSMKWRSIIVSALTVTLFFSFAAAASAAKLLGGDNVELNEPINDDVYVSGGEVEINGTVRGDVVVVGGNLRIKGDVTKDLFVGGGAVIIDGNVGHTARVAGGSVNFSGNVKRDLLVAGGTIILSKNSVVGGDLLAGGGTFRGSGSIKGNVKGGFGNAEFGGPVGGSVDITVDRLTLTRTADLKHNLTYRSANRADIDSDAKIGGKVRRLKAPQARPDPAGRVLAWLWSLASMLAVGLVLAWLFPQSLKLAREALTAQTWASLGIGFAALILVPVAVIMVMFTIVGIPLALIVLGLYALAVYLSQIYAAGALGSMVLDRGGERWVGAGVVVGIAAFSVVRIVPVLGGLVSFFLILFGLGSMIIAGWRFSHPAA